MGITSLKIFFILTIALILGLYGISISEKLPKETGYFVLPVSTGITSFVVFALIFLLLYQFVKRKEVIRRELEPEELERALYECRLIHEKIGEVWYEGKPTGELYNKSWDIAKKITPNLKRLKGYKTFLQLNPGINRGIYLIEKVWEHYSGGKRVKTFGPYKEMGKDLMELDKAIRKVIEKYHRL